MFRTLLRACVATAVLGLVGAGLTAPAGASAHSATQGVTNKEIDIVALVADLTGLRNQGINLPPKLTTENLTRRWQTLADDYRLSALWLITRPVWQAMMGIGGGVWWNNLERIFLAVDDLDCRELMD